DSAPSNRYRIDILFMRRPHPISKVNHPSARSPKSPQYGLSGFNIRPLTNTSSGFAAGRAYTIAGGNEHRVLSCTQNRWKDRRKHDDKHSEALSGRYFFDHVRVGTGATKRELRNVKAS